MIDGALTSEYRCRRCGHLLFKGNLVVAYIEIKCSRGTCGNINSFNWELDNVTVPTLA